MKGKPDTRDGGGRVLCEFCVSKDFDQGRCKKAVVLLRLVSEPEESETDESAKHGSPSGCLKRRDHVLPLVQPCLRVLEDARISPVYVSPGDPWANITRRDRLDYSPSGQRNGEEGINGGQGHKTPVAAESHVGMGGDEVSNLLSPPQAFADGEGYHSV